MEKRRRARINQSLSLLKSIILQDGEHSDEVSVQLHKNKKERTTTKKQLLIIKRMIWPFRNAAVSKATHRNHDWRKRIFWNWQLCICVNWRRNSASKEKCTKSHCRPWKKTRTTNSYFTYLCRIVRDTKRASETSAYSCNCSQICLSKIICLITYQQNYQTYNKTLI